MTGAKSHQSGRRILALDVGEKRIGIAVGEIGLRLAHPLTTLIVDGTEIIRLQALLLEHTISELVIGLPRNLSGEETKQSERIRQFATLRLAAFFLPMTFQDESVTSVLAEERLARNKKGYTKPAIDAQAAAIILQDYLEAHHG